MKDTQYPLNLPGELMAEIRTAAKRTGLSMADVMRQSMKLGLPTLREQLGFERVTNVAPLPDRIARELYAEREDDMASVRKLIAAQPKDAD